MIPFARMDAPDEPVEAFIARWRLSGGAEDANRASFLNELCDILAVDRPPAAVASGGDYRFERGVERHEDDGRTSARRIDLYKRGCFVLEAKQGRTVAPQPSLFAELGQAEQRAMVRHGPRWAALMRDARGQAERYARDVPAAEGWPPFLIVCDIGFCFDLYADFTGTGKNYAQFPDANGFRVYLEDLRDPRIRERLRAVWTAPLSLDPSCKRAAVTRDIAALLAKLVRSLEARHPPASVASFVIRCIFCMFADSVNLFPKRDSFRTLLEEIARDGQPFVVLVGRLWEVMNTGGYSSEVRGDLPQFNGGLFRPGGAHGTTEPLAVTADELAILIQASRKDWADVEPAIFGTLLENALAKKQRDELGAHFTPRAFVERLVVPTVIEPLRRDWEAVQAAASDADSRGARAEAADVVAGFQARLANTRVLDPACGTGNFLYVALELMKRLEGEVQEVLETLRPGEGGRLAMPGATVDPHNFLGLERNPRAVPVAELVLWIGWLQWHFRTHGGRPPAPPILRDFQNIRGQDALLDYKREAPMRDKLGNFVTRWGGRTKPHPITGEDVPDETDRIEMVRPVDVKPTVWPKADFIVGNPPFSGGTDLRDDLGDGYAEALRAAYPDVPASADLAMFFWAKAAMAVATETTRRFGFLTSSSIKGVFSRRVVARALSGRRPVHLVFAIPDHPWSDGHESAALRIAMTVIEAGPGPFHEARPEAQPRLLTVEQEGEGDVPTVTFSERRGAINADLTIGATADTAKPLLATKRIASPGVKLHGAGFLVSLGEARALGLGDVPGLESHIRAYSNGRDLTGRSRNIMVIDMFGLNEIEVRQRFPGAFQHLLTRVRPERDHNPRLVRKKNWWLFGENAPQTRRATSGLSRYIATVETTKHRVFQFLDATILPDNMLICIASDRAFHLGVLSSRTHVEWAILAGGRRGKGNDPRYNKTLCFDPFPFPDASPARQAAIAALAEELDAHRKRVLAAHRQLTLTGLYNVRAALAAGRPLTATERDIHDAGGVGILAHLHEKLDAEVAAAYGWPADLAPREIVARVVALNAERRAEEDRGLVRWLRPEYQAPKVVRTQAAQPSMEIAHGRQTPRWPRQQVDRFMALRAALGASPLAPSDLSRRFQGAKAERVAEMLATLAALGQARADSAGRYSA